MNAERAPSASSAPVLPPTAEATPSAPPRLQRRLNADPFVAADVVQPEILEVTPSVADDRLAFLMD